MKNVLNKVILFMFIIMFGIASLPISVFASSSTDVPGQFSSSGYNNVIDYEAITDTINVHQVTFAGAAPTTATAPTKELDPMSYYKLSFSVTDLDGFNDISIRIKLTRDSELNSTQPDSLIIDWAIIDILHVFTLIDPEENTTWELNPFTLISIATLNIDNVTMDFSVYFSVSKVAPEGNGWSINLEVTDSYNEAYQVDGPLLGTATKTGYSINWYGEILVVSENYKLEWSNVPAGSDYTKQDSIEDMEINSVIVKYISNGSYSEQLRSTNSTDNTAIWDSVVALTGVIKPLPNGALGATLVDDSITLTSQQFALKAVKGLLSESSSSSQITNILSTDFDNQEKTGEIGMIVSLNFYIKLAADFQNGIYRGKVTLGITNIL